MLGSLVELVLLEELEKLELLVELVLLEELEKPEPLVKLVLLEELEKLEPLVELVLLEELASLAKLASLELLASLTGKSSQLSMRSIETCAAGLKVLRLSRSLPKNSARTGNSSPGDQKSTMPPRTEQSPSFSTCGSRS